MGHGDNLPPRQNRARNTKICQSQEKGNICQTYICDYRVQRGKSRIGKRKEKIRRGNPGNHEQGQDGSLRTNTPEPDYHKRLNQSEGSGDSGEGKEEGRQPGKLVKSKRIAPAHRKEPINYQFAAFDTEAIVLDEDAEGVEKHFINFGYFYNGYNYYLFHDAGEFVRICIKLAGDMNKYTIYCHNLGYDIQLVAPFDAFDAEGYIVNTFTFDSAQYIEFTKREGKNKKSILFVSTTNFFRMKLNEAARIAGTVKMSEEIEIKFTREFYLKNKKIMHEYCKRDVYICWQIVSAYKSILDAHDMPDMGLTSGMTAFSVFRHNFLKFPIFTTRPDTVIKNEQAAYYGGRSECFFIGKQKNCRYIDRNSMYAAEMAAGEYPTAYVRTLRQPDIQTLSKSLDAGYLAIAQVSINTDLPIYPYRNKQKLIFPIGNFQTWLATPELEEALKRGHINNLGLVHLYRSDAGREGGLFAEYVKTIYQLRQEYKRQGNAAGTQVMKDLLTNLYGKFAQRQRKNKLVGRVMEYDFRDWLQYQHATKEIIHYRQVGYDLFVVEDTQDETGHSFTALAAHVTSAARRELWLTMEYIVTHGGEVYYTDTDSIITNQAGYKIMEEIGKIDKYQLGAWDDEYDGQSFDLEIYGPKDYRLTLPGKEVSKHKGISDTAETIGPNIYRQRQFQTFRGFLDSGCMLSKHVIKETRLNGYEKGTVLESGWIVPYVL